MITLRLAGLAREPVRRSLLALLRGEEDPLLVPLPLRLADVQQLSLVLSGEYVPRWQASAVLERAIALLDATLEAVEIVQDAAGDLAATALARLPALPGATREAPAARRIACAAVDGIILALQARVPLCIEPALLRSIPQSLPDGSSVQSLLPDHATPLETARRLQRELAPPEPHITVCTTSITPGKVSGRISINTREDAPTDNPLLDLKSGVHGGILRAILSGEGIDAIHKSLESQARENHGLPGTAPVGLLNDDEEDRRFAALLRTMEPESKRRM